MKYRASPKFWASYEALPPAVRKLADANYELLKLDLSFDHPSNLLQALHLSVADGVELHFSFHATAPGCPAAGAGAAIVFEPGLPGRRNRLRETVTVFQTISCSTAK